MKPGFSHHYFAAACRVHGVELIHCDERPGLAVLCVGSGLLMATIDQVHFLGLSVHCALDMGRTDVLGMAHLVDWAAFTADHLGVVVQTWHSRSWASQFADALVEEFPRTVDGSAPIPLFFRLAGLGDDRINPKLPNCQNSAALRETVGAYPWSFPREAVSVGGTPAMG